MTIVLDRNSSRASVKAGAQYFYFYMALSCMAVAFIGFAPTYWVPMARGSLSSPPVVHLHGLLFFAWTIYFVFQSWLASTGRIARHRSTGLIGVSLATAMTIMGFMVSVSVMKRSAAVGQADEGLAFAIVPLSGILFFAVVFALALVHLRDRETHKRLMLLAAISILDAAVARWFLTFLAPPGPPGPPPVSVTIAPALVAYLLLVVAIVFDWRTRGRPHPAYLYGGAALIAVKFLNWPISTTAAWHSFAGGILTLAQ
ncbi:hypothetical protein [Bradyrhizobium lablabi]|uniref:hypothetical protein n=1 Tax=Bradyrhizobium lablabi TaxID=722472 RepID=UPI001BA94DAF|nr:hypothetical protein [Bradyrhizobium lablabi]MBR0696655.1 hypothetical protein [Bradyrhizobium lablabi]